MAVAGGSWTYYRMPKRIEERGILISKKDEYRESIGTPTPFVGHFFGGGIWEGIGAYWRAYWGHP